MRYKCKHKNNLIKFRNSECFAKMQFYLPLSLCFVCFLFLCLTSLPSCWLQATKFCYFLICTKDNLISVPKKKHQNFVGDSIFRYSKMNQSSAFLRICNNTSPRNQLLQHQCPLESHHLVISSEIVPLQCQKGP